jgi:hypothetical protein
MKVVGRVLDEIWQIFWWMVGVAVVIGIVGRSLQIFLSLPVWLKVLICFAIAVACKHWRDIGAYFEKQKVLARRE